MSIIPIPPGSDVLPTNEMEHLDQSMDSTISTPVSSGPETQSTDEMDNCSDSELSSFNTTPAYSPKKESHSHTIAKGDNSLVVKLYIRFPPLEKNHSQIMIKGNNSLIVKLLVVTYTPPMRSLFRGMVQGRGYAFMLRLSFTNVAAVRKIILSAGLSLSTTSMSTAGSQISSGLRRSSRLASKLSIPAANLTSTTHKFDSETDDTESEDINSEDSGSDDIGGEDIDRDEDESQRPVKRAKLSGGKTAAKYYVSAQEGKPDPFGQPPAWADKRQALCETLPYYKAYQSGPYNKGGLVYGLLIDKEGSIRDVFNEEIIITRIGGGRERVEGVSVQTRNTEHRAINKAFRKNIEQEIPVGVIAGQGKTTSPSKLPHYYNVLAWFHVTDVWFEMTSDGVKYGMVRLEKIDLTTKSWWSKAGSPVPDPNRDLSLFQTTSERCEECEKYSTTIFQQGWCCLNASCSEFFEFSGVSFPREKSRGDFYSNLAYNSDFLEKRTRFHGALTQPLIPAPPSLEGIGSNYLGYEQNYGKGVVCPDCGICSRRTQWKQWSCENKECLWTLLPPHPVVSVQQANADVNLEAHKEMCDAVITSTRITLGNYQVVEYVIPGECNAAGNYMVSAGIIRHFISNDFVNGESNGPDDLFRQMQEDDFFLERKPARGHDKVGEMLTNHYYMNWGAPYKFIAPVDSKPFREAPPPILRALKRMTYAGEQSIRNGEHGAFEPFNELLSVGYFEHGSMGYHDDGESTLGPSVASLSLGSSSTMSFRPKKRANIGPPPKKEGGERAALLKVTLKHGDMIVMHGANIQKLYEHAVKPHGKLRFVLTCRHIVPEKIPDRKVRDKAQDYATLPNDHDQYDYNG